MKRCAKCLVVQPLDAFRRCTRSPDGRQLWCKKCHRIWTLADKAKRQPVAKETQGSALEQALVFQIKALKLPTPEREVQLFPDRRWRYDLVWRTARVLAEVNGGTWIRGGHSRGYGQRRDAQKQNRATLDGWACFSFTTDMVTSGEAVQTLEEALR